MNKVSAIDSNIISVLAQSTEPIENKTINSTRTIAKYGGKCFRHLY